MKRTVLALVLTALSAPSSRADAAESRAVPAMTLREATAYARIHQPRLRAAIARLDAVKADADVTRARWQPTILAAAQILATTTNNTTGSYVSMPSFDNPRVSATRAESPSTASLTPAASTLVGLGARQEVYDFGRITAAAAADDLRADAERYSLGATRLVVDYDVAEAYFAVYASKGVLDASDKAYARAVVHRDMAKVGVESGLRRPIELTRAEAELDRYELQRIRGRRTVAAAQAVLAAAIGSPDPLVDTAAEPPAPSDVPSLDAISALAERTPEYRAALARIRAQEKTTHAIETELRPNLFLTGAISGNAGGSLPSSGDAAPAHGLLPVVPNWDVGLVLSWPLFDATVSARADRSRAQEGVQREEASTVRERLVLEIEQAYLDVTAARDALPVLRRALDAAVANYDQANFRFTGGLGNAVELADAEDLRTNAEIDLALGTFEIARARAALERAVAEGA
jgi:outer membrane protein